MSWHEHKWVPLWADKPTGLAACRCKDTLMVYAIEGRVVREVRSKPDGVHGRDYDPDGNLVGIWKDLPPRYPSGAWPR